MAIIKYAQAEYMDALMREIVDRALVDTEITEEEKEKLKKKNTETAFALYPSLKDWEVAVC
ncbi:MAG: hypothetical protein IJ871_09075 [Ruminococcus sp.]|nr:hypothetical protein [Ruminococcus sp.]